MINAGAIIICSLLKTLYKPEMSSAEKFDFTMNFFEVSSFKYFLIIKIYNIMHQMIQENIAQTNYISTILKSNQIFNENL